MVNQGDVGTGVQTIRLPWYSTEMQRAHHPENSVYTNSGAQQFVNCFPVLQKNPLSPDQGRQQIISRAPLQSTENLVDLSTVVNNTDRIIAVDMISMGQLDDVLVVAYHDRSNDYLYIVQYRPWADTCLQIGYVTGFSTNHTASLSEIEISNVPGIALSVYARGNTSVTTSGWYATTTSGLFTAASLTEISDTDFPPKQTPARPITGRFVQMDGYTFIMTKDGSIYNSDLNSISAWNTSGYVDASSRPDLGRTLVRYKHHIVAFGESSIEFFNDAGIAPPASPLERTNQAFINFGCVGPKAVINIDDTLYWIAQSEYNTIGLWKLEGYTPVRLSENTQNMMLMEYSEQVCLQTFMMAGLRHIFINSWNTHAIGWLEDPNESSPISPDNNVLWGTPVYCVDTKAWWWWAFEFGLSPPTSSTGYSVERIFCAMNRASILPNTSFFMLSTSYLDGTTNNNYGAHVSWIRAGQEQLGSSLSYETTRDGNATTLFYWRVPVQIVTNVYDFGTNNRKRISRAKIIANDMSARKALATGEPWTSFSSEGLTYRFGWTNYNQAIRYSASVNTPSSRANLWHINYRPLTVDLSTGVIDTLDDIDPETASRYYFNNLGMAREWAFVFNCSTFTPLTLEGLELTLQIGAH